MPNSDTKLIVDVVLFQGTPRLEAEGATTFLGMPPNSPGRTVERIEDMLDDGRLTGGPILIIKLGGTVPDRIYLTVTQLLEVLAEYEVFVAPSTKTLLDVFIRERLEVCGLKDRIIAYIGERPDLSATKSEISKRFQVSTDKLDQALDELEAAETLESDFNQPQSGIRGPIPKRYTAL